jgi:hypothetical protein
MRRFLLHPAMPIAATVIVGFACSTGSATDHCNTCGAAGGAGGTIGSSGTSGGSLAVGGTPATGGTGGVGGAGGTGGTGGSVSGAGGALSAGGSGAGTPPVAGQGGAAGGGAAGGSAGSGAAGGPAGGSAGNVATGGTAGASGSAGSPSGYPGTVIIEDDFDAASTVDAKWFAYPDFDATQQPKIDTTRTHTPPNAIKLTPSSSGVFLMNQMGMGLPAAGNKFYARVWVNFEKATSAVGGHSAFLVGAVGKDNAGTELRLGMSGPPGGTSTVMLDLNLINATDGGGGEVTRFSNGFTTGGNPGDFTGMGFGFAANEWYCVEALFDGAGSEFKLWVAETEITELAVHDFSANSTPREMWGPTFNYIKIGGQNYSGNIGPVWYDDIFVGTEPVGCTR